MAAADHPPHSDAQFTECTPAERSCPRLLWVDLCLHRDLAQPIDGLADLQIHTIRPLDVGEVAAQIARVQPEVICVDLDFPALSSLRLLRQTKCNHPRIPILLLTALHSESLAVWAFRAAVRSYEVKPLDSAKLHRQVQALAALRRAGADAAPRQNGLEVPPIPAEFRFEAAAADTPRTALAVGYVQLHRQEKIRLTDVARLCGMSRFAFSRTFRHEHGMPFREYLLRHRIEEARKLLDVPSLSVTEVAGLVGLNDVSSFGRLFQRYFGMSPSAYRRRLRAGHLAGGKNADGTEPNG